jgi:hypothetical protein
MATFAQWYFKRPKSDEEKISYLSKSRMVLITGSQLRFINYVYEWWINQYKDIEETVTVFADEPDFWDLVFQSQVTHKRLVRILRAENIVENEYKKFEQFKKSKQLRGTRLIVKEHQKEKVDSTLLKYRPFIKYWAGRYINCQRLNPKDCIDFVKSELSVNIWLAKSIIEFCGSQSAVLATIQMMKLSGIRPTSSQHVKLFAVRDYGNVLAELLLRKKYREAYALAEEGKVNIDLFIGAIAYKIMELGSVIYISSKEKVLSKRELAYRAQVPIWRIDDLLEMSKGITMKKLKSYATLISNFEPVSHEYGALEWLISNWR